MVAKIIVSLISFIAIFSIATGCGPAKRNPEITATPALTVKATSTINTDTVKISPFVSQTSGPAVTYLPDGTIDPTSTITTTLPTQAPVVTVQPTDPPTEEPVVTDTPSPLPTPNALGYTVYFSKDMIGNEAIGIGNVYKPGSKFYFLLKSNQPCDFTELKAYIYKQDKKGEYVDNVVYISNSKTGWTELGGTLLIYNFGTYRVAFLKNGTEEIASAYVTIMW